MSKVQELSAVAAEWATWAMCNTFSDGWRSSEADVKQVYRRLKRSDWYLRLAKEAKK